MNEYRLQTKITYSTRREVDSHAKKRELERDVENLNAKIKKHFRKTFAFVGAIVLVCAVVSFAFNYILDYTIFFVLAMWNFTEFVILLNDRQQTKRILKVWNANPLGLNEN